ncbi:hypothetical protein QOZ80_7AG0558320 [Eleusine coracana subsp. coracana]|nr:hypothetical protein QOZ80_7AG0558320 [Eleusine coracana subsp. coracana]
MAEALSPLNGVAAVVGLLVSVAFPDHNPAVVGGLLHDRDHAVEEVLGVDIANDLLRRRQADVDLRVRVGLGPLFPLQLPVRGAVPVPVEPDVDASDEPGGESPVHLPVRELAPRRGHQLHRRPAPEVLVVIPQAPRQHVVVGRRPGLDEEVDAVHVGVAEGAVRARAGAGEVGEPEVLREVLRCLGAGKRVPVAEAPDGEVDEVAVRLAVFDVIAEAGDGVARDVEVVLAVAEDVEEGDDHDGVRAGVTGLTEGALRLVPAPEHGHLPRLPRRRRRAGEEDGDEGYQGKDGGCPPHQAW